MRDDAEFSAPGETAPGRPFGSPRPNATSAPPRTRYDIHELMGMARTLIADVDRRASELERASRRPRLEDDEWCTP
ncbi:hypothetical protein [Mycobacterium sp. Marseille-P9652]|uniref:hypothetical protein n=1 Tax=Mycobacterium sp. Marseille-P9652 TaxID=2654950 RepID=UPI0012E7F186|nr:hypothetical protein [Mycobacterium sp. Marseille-P9652]